MRIKKMYQGTVPENKILNTYSTSQTDTYSCNYLNNKTKMTTLYTGNQTCSALNTGVDVLLSGRAGDYDFLIIEYSSVDSVRERKTCILKTIYATGTGITDRLYAISSYNTTVEFYCNGYSTLSFKVREVQGWIVGQIQLNKVYGIKF